MPDKSIESSLWARELRNARGILVGHQVFCNSGCVARYLGVSTASLEAGALSHVYPYESDCAEWCYNCGARCNLGDERCTEDCLKLDDEKIEAFICKHGYPDWIHVDYYLPPHNRMVLTQPFVEWMIAKKWGLWESLPRRTFFYYS